MRGIVLSEEGHFVNLLPPVDITGGKSGDIFNMKEWMHATIGIQIGVSSAAFTKILVYKCSDAAGSNPEAIAFDLYAEETALGDTLSEREAVTAAGRTPSPNNSIAYIIELDAAELVASDDKPWVLVTLTNGTNSVIGAMHAWLTGGRYKGPASPTVLS